GKDAAQRVQEGPRCRSRRVDARDGHAHGGEVAQVALVNPTGTSRKVTCPCRPSGQAKMFVWTGFVWFGILTTLVPF
uniref:Uncharacterized protein n=1 Tax=Aegilops tauschii subsp. strangulata TaxID=200361 RepID=A0A452Y4T5_AEGTS